jgi:pheophorbide a oxygenase
VSLVDSFTFCFVSIVSLPEMVSWSTPLTRAALLGFLFLHGPVDRAVDAFSTTTTTSPQVSIRGRPRSGGPGSSHFATLASPPRISNKKEDKADDDEESSSSFAAARPLTEHWWPVATIASLDPTRPNALQVLGRKIVAYYNAKASSWVVLDDRCRHRFAPLSEGRLVIDDTTATTRLQCAYHGWQFDPCGACACIPQLQSPFPAAAASDDQQRTTTAAAMAATKTTATKGATTAAATTTAAGLSVRAYPVQVRVGLLWVWTGDHDPAGTAMATTALPISALLQRFVDFYGNDACFMRDLPYGMELLGENLLDLSHLPFSHHSVGKLKRELGQELQLKRVSVPRQPADGSRPLYQAEVQNAGEQDPIFAGLHDPAANRREWQSHISFYHPCHVRYERNRGGSRQANHVELFMCPLAAGRSRVFVYNIYEFILPALTATSTGHDKANNTSSSLGQVILRSLSPKVWLARWRMMQLRKLFRPSRLGSHMLNHRIFDGDGIFLHKQGNRMSANHLTYRDYTTPSSSDILINAYRRYLDKAAVRSDPVSAQSVGGGSGGDFYADTAPRSVLLDRYFSHTVHCPTCRTAFRRGQDTKQRLATLRTAVTGATGAAVLSLCLAAAVAASWRRVIGTTPRAAVAVATTPTVIVLFVAALSGVIFSYLLGRWEKRTEQYVHKFVFEDYVHAEND